MTPERWKQIEGLYHSAYAPGRRRSRRVSSPRATMPPCDAKSKRCSTNPNLPKDSCRRAHSERCHGSPPCSRRHDGPCARRVKVLPREFTSDWGRLARLEREARMLALNHPNICGMSTDSRKRTPRASWCSSSSKATHSRRGSARLASPSCARGPDDCATDSRGSRGRARTRGHPPGPEAVEHQRSRRPAWSRSWTSGWPSLSPVTAPERTSRTQPQAEDSQVGHVIGTAAYMSPNRREASR